MLQLMLQGGKTGNDLLAFARLVGIAFLEGSACDIVNGSRLRSVVSRMSRSHLLFEVYQDHRPPFSC